MHIAVDSPVAADVRLLLDEHLSEMRATSPPESVHALDHAALLAPSITFWTARDEGGALLGCVALSELGPAHGEVKSMRTAVPARGRGVGAALVRHVLAEARSRGYGRLSLETGTQEFFASARRLYGRHGFTECGPFADYRPDPFSTFMTLVL
ncbi:GNAT family N-acetyltransferase [Myceligenerans salitolerans]|uniref:GNAT family N-acetyltransferase n=1 Tax=Myceligenerans salitolerans TaxID=1230528 RepID=A0ABS3I8S7_9MICO|nr:GNAT family N-acetyltransferase [Myceligenerans salitolerans]MBO0609426.1 GNAT family N-acetyltransferase [Myceligenerans salitolerans]